MNVSFEQAVFSPFPCSTMPHVRIRIRRYVHHAGNNPRMPQLRRRLDIRRQILPLLWFSGLQSPICSAHAQHDLRSTACPSQTHLRSVRIRMDHGKNAGL